MEMSSGVVTSPFPSFQRPFKGGVAAQRPGWLVKGRVASFLFEVTNHPVCAAKERDLFINGAATPP